MNDERPSEGQSAADTTSFRYLVKSVVSDYHHHRPGRPGFRGVLKGWYSPSFRLLLNFRIGKFLATRKRLSAILPIMVYRQYSRHGCCISYLAEIGQCVEFLHPLSVVIGERVKIHDNVKIWQSVTLGSHGRKGTPKRYPVIGKGAKVYAGATILGGVKIGDNAIIAANALVLSDVPPDSTAVGQPARILNAS